MKKFLSNTFNFAVNAGVAVGGSYLLFKTGPLLEAVKPIVETIASTPVMETLTAFKNAVVGNHVNALEAVGGAALVSAGVTNKAGNWASAAGSKILGALSFGKAKPA